MKIAIAANGDPKSVKTWSGIPHYLVRALEKKGHEVIGIQLRLPAYSVYDRILLSFYWHIRKRWFRPMFEKSFLLHTSKQLDEAVAEIQPDIVLVIKADYLAYTTFKQPSITIHDATFAVLVDYYDVFYNLCQRTINSGNRMYQNALEKAYAAVFSADWASKSAIRDYGISANKIHTIPLGANIEKAPDPELVTTWIKERSEKAVCTFLFLGIDWERKGGADALQMVLELNRMGIKAVLNVIGCTPDIQEADRPYIHLMGFMRKDVPAEYERLVQSIAESHAILLPSLAECYGCVFCEVNAFGLPALGRDTGGISEIIKDGHNGLLLGPKESPAAFARRWKTIWEDKSLYIDMSHRARKEYDERLNYDVFVTRLEKIMDAAVS